MNNLHELYKISEELITPLQASVVFLSGKHLHDAMRAADELAALNARVEELEKQLKDAQKVAVYFANLNPKALASIGARRLVRTYELRLKGAE